MTSSGPGCPANAFEGATRRANAFVARRVEKHVYMLFDWEATPDLSRALRCEKSKWWSFLRKYDRIVSIFGGIDSHAWRSKATRKHVSGFLPHFSFIRERYIVPVSSNFLTQISCGIKTKCRKTRAMQRNFTIVDSLALRPCNTSMIPDTHSLKLLFLIRYTPRLGYLYLRTCK